MKIKYEFADGMVSEVEVEESIGAVIIEDRRLEDNLSRRERYHCYSLDAAVFEGMDYAAEGTPETLLAAMEEDRQLYEAFRQLSRVQRRSILMLAGGLSVNEIARREGVHHSVVTVTALMASGILDSSLAFHIGEAKKKRRHQRRNGGNFDPCRLLCGLVESMGGIPHGKRNLYGEIKNEFYSIYDLCQQNESSVQEH